MERSPISKDLRFKIVHLINFLEKLNFLSKVEIKVEIFVKN